MLDEIRKKHETESVFEVLPENRKAVDIFLRMSSQWNVVASMGGAVYLGLNYQSLEFLFTLYKVKNRRRMFEDIRIMEKAALALMNKKKD